jgi:group II intron reverse transcriptase/maturase
MLRKGAAPGIDGVTVSEYGENLDENIKDLITRMKSWQYRPQPARRIDIPKGDGKIRPLAIPAVEDKIVQMGIKQFLNEIFEPVFLDMSYGFRNKLSCHDAIRAVNKSIDRNPVNWVVDADVEDFFGSVDHKLLMKALKVRIADRNFLRLISRFLKSGVMKDGSFWETDRGTPQGGIISPVLGNIYLHYALDLWFEREVVPSMRGFAELIRYADDFVVCFQHKSDAMAFLEMLRERFVSLGLKLASHKTKIVEFGQVPWDDWRNGGNRPGTFDFLGFTHICGTTRRGKFKIEVKTSRKRFVEKLKLMNVWLKKVRCWKKLMEWWPLLRSKLQGHFIYYGITGNSEKIWDYLKWVKTLVFKWINRRSQKRSFTWKRFLKHLRRHPLPKPKIYHSLFASGR